MSRYRSSHTEAILVLSKSVYQSFPRKNLSTGELEGSNQLPLFISSAQHDSYLNRIGNCPAYLVGLSLWSAIAPTCHCRKFALPASHSLEGRSHYYCQLYRLLLRISSKEDVSLSVVSLFSSSSGINSTTKRKRIVPVIHVLPGSSTLALSPFLIIS